MRRTEAAADNNKRKQQKSRGVFMDRLAKVRELAKAEMLAEEAHRSDSVAAVCIHAGCGFEG